MVGIVLSLAGANADSPDYRGRKGTKTLFHHVLLSAGGMLVLSRLAVLTAVALNESVGQALQYGAIVPGLCLGLWGFFRRIGRS